MHVVQDAEVRRLAEARKRWLAWQKQLLDAHTQEAFMHRSPTGPQAPEASHSRPSHDAQDDESRYSEYPSNVQSSPTGTKFAANMAAQAARAARFLGHGNLPPGLLGLDDLGIDEELTHELAGAEGEELVLEDGESEADDEMLIDI